MLSVHQITKSFGVTPLLENISFTVNPGERWGLVGVNGSGKSTLLRILAGKEQADGGSFSFSPANLRLDYLPQGLSLPAELTLDEYLHSTARNLDSLSEELGFLAQTLAARPHAQNLQDRYDEVLAQLTLISQEKDVLPATLAGLGLDHLPADTPISHLSGGQKTRLMLASLLLHNPQILLLDEPTNHLDLEMLNWLEDWILKFPGGVLMVSHDRTFLNRTVSGILDLDEHSHHLRAYEGSYDQYLQKKISERDQQLQAYKDQQDEIRRLRVSAREVRSRAKFHKGGKADPTRTDGFAVGFLPCGKELQKAKNLEKRVEKLLNEDKIERPERSWQMHVDFDKPEIRSRDVLIMEDLSVGYPGLRLVEHINRMVQYGQHIALSGANGCGKTTLIKTITG